MSINGIPQNVFVLCTGRSGSVTFAKAASHIANFSAGHETRCPMIGADRLDFPKRHIEADNRLSWILGRLDDAYGANAHYVHLTRDREAVAKSFLARWSSYRGIIGFYRSGVLMSSQEEPLQICRDYVDTVTSNIQFFLRDKPNKMTFRLESAESDWERFWNWIGAQGDLNSSLEEWRVQHNSSAARRPRIREMARNMSRVVAHKLDRLA